MKKIVFATNNKHKIGEVCALLETRGILPGINSPTEAQGEKYEILSLAEIGCTEDIPETSDTFLGNARQKAYYIKEKYGYDCFADDSGLEVTALGMQPGVRSARYASEIGHDSEANIAKLMKNMEGVTDRSAQFRTVICLLLDGEEHVFEGICRGRITTERSGNQGFGYDPVFAPEGYNETFADQPLELKNSISHRGKAVAKLIDFLAK